MKLYLFGSRARGDHRPDSDWDVLIDGVGMAVDHECDEIVHLLAPYTVEHGGKLDLFYYMGDCLMSAIDEERRIILSKWNLQGIQEDAKEIDVNELLYQMTRDNLSDFGTVRDANGNYIG